MLRAAACLNSVHLPAISSRSPHTHLCFFLALKWGKEQAGAVACINQVAERVPFWVTCCLEKQMDCHIVNLPTFSQYAALKCGPSTCSLPPPYLPSFFYHLTHPPVLSSRFPISVFYLLLSVSVCLCPFFALSFPPFGAMTRRSKLETCVTSSY